MQISNSLIKEAVKSTLILQFHQSVREAERRFGLDAFAAIKDGRLKLKKDDKTEIPEVVTRLQKVIDTNAIHPHRAIAHGSGSANRFSRHFMPVQQHQARSKNLYKALISALISQATNLGVVAMSASGQDVSVDKLRHVLQLYIREDTLKAASAEIVNWHHRLPFSEVHGSGALSSSDAQRFKIRADSLLAAYYPRYYGYHEKIMNKASGLSLVSNAILYWNTSRISNIVDVPRTQGETVDSDTLAHISLLPYKHVLPNGTYFIKDEEGINEQGFTV